MTELIRNVSGAFCFAAEACFQDSSLASQPWARLLSSAMFGSRVPGSAASLLLSSPLPCCYRNPELTLAQGQQRRLRLG